MNQEHDIWFRRKSFGWGWTPATWQGWAVLGVWAILFYFAITTFEHEWLIKTIAIAIITGLLILVCYLKGEKPKWQWGGKK